MKKAECSILICLIMFASSSITSQQSFQSASERMSYLTGDIIVLTSGRVDSNTLKSDICNRVSTEYYEEIAVKPMLAENMYLLDFKLSNNLRAQSIENIDKAIFECANDTNELSYIEFAEPNDKYMDQNWGKCGYQATFYTFYK